MQSTSHHKKRGFTLIEMLVAIFVFSIVMTIATGAVFTIIKANRTSQSLKSVLDNLSTALDTMSVTLRYGSNYYCSGSSDTPPDCAHGGTDITFIDHSGNNVEYNFVNHGIERTITNSSGSSNTARLTAAEVLIQSLNFYVTGATQPATGNTQPTVLIVIKGQAGNGENTSGFNIETLVSQRRPDSI